MSQTNLSQRHKLSQTHRGEHVNALQRTKTLLNQHCQNQHPKPNQHVRQQLANNSIAQLRAHVRTCHAHALPHVRMHHVCMYAWQNEQQHDVLTTQICTTKKIASTGASVLAVQHHGPGPTHQATFCGVLVGNVAMQIRSSQCDLNCIAHHRGPPIFVAADLVNATWCW